MLFIKTLSSSYLFSSIPITVHRKLISKEGKRLHQFKYILKQDRSRQLIWAAGAQCHQHFLFIKEIIDILYSEMNSLRKHSATRMRFKFPQTCSSSIQWCQLIWVHGSLIAKTNFVRLTFAKSFC